MTEEECREMYRQNWAAQMEGLGYDPSGNPLPMKRVSKPRILTIDEVCESCDQAAVWVQQVGVATPMIALYYREHYPNLYFQRPYGEVKYHGYSYGKSWRCWDQKPSEEQMKEVLWNEETGG